MKPTARHQLARLQQNFQDCILHSRKPSSLAWVSAEGRAVPEIQLAVYSHAYRARLQEVLANDYPAMQRAMGDDAFNHLLHAYIDACPSRYFSLGDFGNHLPAFIFNRIRHQGVNNDRPWLYELALFEYTLAEAFDAADAIPLSEQDMLAIPPGLWPALRFTVHPSLRRLDLEWNSVEIWQALTTDPPAAVTARLGAAEPWLIWRDEQLVTRFRSLQRAEQQALDDLCAGDSFGHVCERLTGMMAADQVPLRAAGLLRSWIAQGLVCGLR